MSKSLADNPFITEMKDKNGDSWYHQIVLELKDKEIERLNKELERWIKLIDYKGIEDIPQYVSDLEFDNKQLKEENQLLNNDLKEEKKIRQKAIDYILNKSIEYKPGYRKVDLNTKDCTELLDILESEIV